MAISLTCKATFDMPFAIDCALLVALQSKWNIWLCHGTLEAQVPFPHPCWMMSCSKHAEHSSAYELNASQFTNKIIFGSWMDCFLCWETIPWRSLCGTWNVNLTRFNILCYVKNPDMFNAADMPEDNGVPA